MPERYSYLPEELKNLKPKEGTVARELKEEIPNIEEEYSSLLGDIATISQEYGLGGEEIVTKLGKQIEMAKKDLDNSGGKPFLIAGYFDKLLDVADKLNGDLKVTRDDRFDKSMDGEDTTELEQRETGLEELQTQVVDVLISYYAQTFPQKEVDLRNVPNEVEESGKAEKKKGEREEKKEAVIPKPKPQASPNEKEQASESTGIKWLRKGKEENLDVVISTVNMSLEEIKETIIAFKSYSDNSLISIEGFDDISTDIESKQKEINDEKDQAKKNEELEELRVDSAQRLDKQIRLFVTRMNEKFAQQLLIHEALKKDNVNANEASKEREYLDKNEAIIADIKTTEDPTKFIKKLQELSNNNEEYFRGAMLSNETVVAHLLTHKTRDDTIGETVNIIEATANKSVGYDTVEEYLTKLRANENKTLAQYIKEDLKDNSSMKTLYDGVISEMEIALMSSDEDFGLEKVSACRDKVFGKLSAGALAPADIESINILLDVVILPIASAIEKENNKRLDLIAKENQAAITSENKFAERGLSILFKDYISKDEEKELSPELKEILRLKEEIAKQYTYITYILATGEGPALLVGSFFDNKNPDNIYGQVEELKRLLLNPKYNLSKNDIGYLPIFVKGAVKEFKPSKATGQKENAYKPITDNITINLSAIEQKIISAQSAEKDRNISNKVNEYAQQPTFKLLRNFMVHVEGAESGGKSHNSQAMARALKRRVIGIDTVGTRQFLDEDGKSYSNITTLEQAAQRVEKNYAYWSYVMQAYYLMEFGFDGSALDGNRARYSIPGKYFDTLTSGTGLSFLLDYEHKIQTNGDSSFTDLNKNILTKKPPTDGPNETGLVRLISSLTAALMSVPYWGKDKDGKEGWIYHGEQNDSSGNDVTSCMKEITGKMAAEDPTTNPYDRYRHYARQFAIQSTKHSDVEKNNIAYAKAHEKKLTEDRHVLRQINDVLEGPEGTAAWVKKYGTEWRKGLTETNAGKKIASLESQLSAPLEIKKEKPASEPDYYLTYVVEYMREAITKLNNIKDPEIRDAYIYLARSFDYPISDFGLRTHNYTMLQKANAYSEQAFLTTNEGVAYRPSTEYRSFKLDTNNYTMHNVLVYEPTSVDSYLQGKRFDQDTYGSFVVPDEKKFAKINKNDNNVKVALMREFTSQYLASQSPYFRACFHYVDENGDKIKIGEKTKKIKENGEEKEVIEAIYARYDYSMEENDLHQNGFNLKEENFLEVYRDTIKSYHHPKGEGFSSMPPLPSIDGRAMFSKLDYAWTPDNDWQDLPEKTWLAEQPERLEVKEKIVFEKMAQSMSGILDWAYEAAKGIGPQAVRAEIESLGTHVSNVKTWIEASKIKSENMDGGKKEAKAKEDQKAWEERYNYLYKYITSLIANKITRLYDGLTMMNQDYLLDMGREIRGEIVDDAESTYNNQKLSLYEAINETLSYINPSYYENGIKIKMSDELRQHNNKMLAVKYTYENHYQKKTWPENNAFRLEAFYDLIGISKTMRPPFDPLRFMGYGLDGFKMAAVKEHIRNKK